MLYNALWYEIWNVSVVWKTMFHLNLSEIYIVISKIILVDFFFMEYMFITVFILL